MYCGYVVKVEKLRKHSNADKLQVLTVFGNDTIVDLNVRAGDVGVYFPVDGQLSKEFCAEHKLCRAEGGYLDDAKRNIKAIKLRGEKSDGLYLPISCLSAYCNIDELAVGTRVDVLNGMEICRKYIPHRNSYHTVTRAKKAGKARVNIAPTFHEHVDTEQLAYNMDKFKRGDVIELTLKMHGTSGRTGYLPLLKRHKGIGKILDLIGKPKYEYGYVNGTRRVVLDEETQNQGYYNDNTFREEAGKLFEGKLDKGEVVYYEIVGYIPATQAPIMPPADNARTNDKDFIKRYGAMTEFSYGCAPTPPMRREGSHIWYDSAVPPFRVFVYRMTMVNEDGVEVDYSPDRMRMRCEQMAVDYVPVFERFIIPADAADPGEYVKEKAELYYDGPDPIGKTHIREGVVARIVSSPTIALYKHKSFYFKVIEGIIKDNAAAPDMEEAQE